MILKLVFLFFFLKTKIERHSFNSSEWSDSAFRNVETVNFMISYNTTPSPTYLCSSAAAVGPVAALAV